MSQASARVASSRPRFSASFASGSASLVSPSDAASACNSAAERPRLDPGKSVNMMVEARLPSSARKPCSVLVAGERDDRHARTGEIGRKGEIAQHGPDVERHMRAVQNDRNAPGP